MTSGTMAPSSQSFNLEYLIILLLSLEKEFFFWPTAAARGTYGVRPASSQEAMSSVLK